MELLIYKTPQLTQELKETFNKIWNKARMKTENIFEKTPIKNEDLYFFYINNNNNQPVSVGRYRYITDIKLNEEKWTQPVWGRANIATDPKYQGKGYGKQLILGMNDYAIKRNMWVIGFHGKSTNLSSFYRKCGLEIDLDIGKRIYFPKNGHIKNHENSAVSYFKGDPLIEIIKSTNKIVSLPYSW